MPSIRVSNEVFERAQKEFLELCAKLGVKAENKGAKKAQRKLERMLNPRTGDPIPTPAQLKKALSERDAALLSGYGLKASPTGKSMPRTASGKSLTETERLRGLTVYISQSKLDNLRAIAAADDLSVQPYLEKLIDEAIEKKAALIELGNERLAKGKRPYRPRAVTQLAKENRLLTERLLKAGIKP